MTYTPVASNHAGNQLQPFSSKATFRIRTPKRPSSQWIFLSVGAIMRTPLSQKPLSGCKIFRSRAFSPILAENKLFVKLYLFFVHII